MTPRMIVTLAVVLGVVASPTRAQVAPGDSLMHAYVRSLADSSDAWFGATAAPTDTAGLDSALTVGLARRPGTRARARTRLEFAPSLAFDRANGGRVGTDITLRRSNGLRLQGTIVRTTGSRTWLGEGGVVRVWRGRSWRHRVTWSASAGRWVESFDREHLDDLTSSLDAFVTGSDRQDLLRRDGFRTSLVIRDGTGETMLAWRDQGESSLPVTTRWTLLHRSLSRPDNRTAREARVRELGFGMLETIPFTRLRVRAEAWTSDRALGSGLDYRRVHVTVGGDVSLGRHWGFVPQLDYGRLYGTPVPQAGFALGGTHSLRTIPSYTQLATGRAIARGELVLADDLRERLHLPLPAWLPLQVSTFAASAAVWGLDATGHEPARTRRDAPRAEDWRSEVGVALLWRPGIPEPSNFVRLDVARPIGPRDHRSTSVTFTVQRLIDLLPAPR